MTILLSHAAATWFMVGLIWTIQLVHYPLFAQVGESAFGGYERSHTSRMGALLVVPASLEVLTGAMLVWLRPEGLDLALAWAGGFILAALWVTTLLVQVPLHRRLSSRRSEHLIDQLVSTNWVRTSGWTIRGLIVGVMLSQTL